MRKNIVTALIAATVLIMSGCADTNTAPAAPATPSAPATPKTPEAPTPDAATLKRMMSSPLVFANETHDLATWGGIVSQSKWAEKLREGGTTFTLLCPDVAALRANYHDFVSLLKDSREQALRDKVVGKHILKQQLSFEKLMQMETVEAIDGSMLKIDHKAGTIGGAPMTRREQVTEKGILIVMGEIVEMSPVEAKKYGEPK